MKGFREGITLRKYAAALHDASIAQKNDILIRRYLDELSTLLNENRELRDALVSPCNRAADKKRVLDSLFADEYPEILRKCLYLMIDNGRAALIPRLTGHLQKIVLTKKNLHIAEVRTAFETDDRIKEQVSSFLSSKAGEALFQINYTVDSSLIGGFVVSYNNNVYDCSIAGSLHRLTQSLM